MARKSRWQQFTDNFNAMSSTFDEAFKTYEINKIKKRDYFEDEDETIKLEGDALRSAQFADIADVYEKYGDVEGAMKLRTSDATLQGLMRDNRIGAATEQDQIYLKGAGARAQLDSGIAANNAATAASNSTTRLRNLEVEAAELQAQQQAKLNEILTTHAQGEYASEEAENTALITAFKNSGLPPAIVNPALEGVQKFGATAIALESDRILGGAMKALRSGNPDDFVTYYNKEIADGFELDIAPGANGTFVATAKRGDEVQTIAEAASQEELLNLFTTRLKDPLSVLGGAVDNLAYRQSKANLGKTGAETEALESDVRVDEANINRIASQINVDTAQVAKLTKDLELTDARIAEVVANTTFVYGVKTDQLQAEIANINSQISSRGISDGLNREKKTLIAAQAAETKAKTARLDPSRERSEAEREEQLRSDLSDLAKKMQIAMIPADEQQEMIDAYLALMANAANITIEEQ
jgi:hypothetical protein